MKEFVCDYLSKEVTVNGRKLNVSFKIVQLNWMESYFLCSTTTYMELISFFFPLEIVNNNHDGFLHLNLLSHKIICSAATLLLCPLIANVMHYFAPTEPSGPWCLYLLLSRNEKILVFFIQVRC